MLLSTHAGSRPAYLSMLLALCLSPAGAHRLIAQEPAERELFDGKTLAGWEGNTDWFRVEDESIVAGSLERAIPNNQFLCTEQRFENFELTLEAKLLGAGKNAGVQFRSERIPMHHEVIGYQCDMGESAERPIWGSLYDESRRRRFLAEGQAAQVKAALKPQDWNTLRIRCVGPRIQIWLNDQLTVDYEEPDAEIPRRGKIALQIHSGAPAEAWYRNIRLRELPAE